MDYTPHFTVGNMKRSLDVVAATGDKIVALWADPYVFLSVSLVIEKKEGRRLTR
jgi:hypothetical protein